MDNISLQPAQDAPTSPPKKRPDKTRMLGVTQVYPDPKDVLATEEKEIDIFVIHGLDARSDKTFVAWRVDGDKTSGDVHWLSDEDMLPAKMPQARVLTYDWNANYDKTASKETMRNHADTLLERVHLNRDALKRTQVPIIFIASCFGGVLLSAALAETLEPQHPRAEQRKQIYDCCVGVVFLGTPFRGSWVTGTEAARLRIEAAKRANPEDNIQYSMELVQYLKEGTDDQPSPLGYFVDRFQQSIHNPKYRIPCGYLYETQPAQYAGPLSRLSPEHRNSQTVIDKDGQGIVVSHKSAVLGGGDGSGQPMRHNMMHKYNSPNNPAFQSLCLRLREFSERADDTIESRDRARLGESEVSARNELKSWSERFSFHNMDHRHMELGSEKNKATSETCEWLFNHDKYEAWESDDFLDSSNSTLIIQGKAGSGKSTLMYEAVTRSEAMPKTICLSYFFDAAKDNGLPIQISPQGLYRSLLSQLLRKLSRSPEVVAIFREWGPATEARQEVVEDVVILQHRITRLLATLRGRTVRIFIDAIDKCGSGRDDGTDNTIDMLRYIQGLDGKGTKVLVLFSIRDRAQYGSYLSAPAIEMSRHNQKDIYKYLNTELNYSRDPETREQIIRTLLRRSSNNFLWVKLVVETLNKKADAGLADGKWRGEVDRLPKELGGLYGDLLNNLDSEDRAEALILLQLTQVRIRPLEVMEMHSALEYARGSDNKPDKDGRSEEVFEAHIRRISRGFIEVQVSEDPHGHFRPSNVRGVQAAQDSEDLCELAEEEIWIPPAPKRLVQFTHDSVRDFLDKYVSIEHDIKPSYGSSGNLAHFEVTKLCMRAAGHGSKQEPFLPYASHFWTVHARKANEAIQDDFDPPKFITSCNYKTKGIVSRYKEHATEPYSLYYIPRIEIPNTGWLDDKATMLMLLAFEGCGALITKHGAICTRKDCREDESTIQDAFALALLRGWRAGVEAVRDLAQKRSISLDPTVKPLFTNGICPLRRVCSRNQHEILESVLSIGWDTTSRAARVSFCEGVKLGHDRIVELFLEDAGDNAMDLLSWQSGQGYTALHFAASAGRWRIFDMLLGSLDDVQPELLSIKAKGGETVLDMAERGKKKHQMRRDSDQIIELIQEILAG
ncbi:ankyrin repeat [Fusarium pseudocircinatum]|uniref:Ankyrin repeat n=1 Tax=Fusarium pseudocircinatum TaxID=56676 RepID=A0A8H5PG93_9HYPO|nr:ankyrin repeat [Fusarium pseudocircinatum]